MGIWLAIEDPWILDKHKKWVRIRAHFFAAVRLHVCCPERAPHHAGAEDNRQGRQPYPKQPKRLLLQAQRALAWGEGSASVPRGR